MSKRWIRTITTASMTAVLIGGAATVASAYTVHPGDTLSGIAASHGTTWRTIYADNRSVIGANPDLIFPGQVLRIGDPKPREQTAKVSVGVAASASVVLPVGDYHLTATFGQCGEHWANCHTGLDFAAPHGATVRAIRGGDITSSGWAGAYGQQVVVDHGDGTTSSYSHLSAITASGHVGTGDPIGAVGSTGNTTGPHVHLEVVVGGATVDPAAWLAERGATP